MTPQILEERLIDFAVTSVCVVESLPNTGIPDAIAECDELIAIFVSQHKSR